MNVPVVLVIFNRPELTREVFGRIAAARPPALFVVADGPRTEEEAAACREARAIAAAVDWPCDLHLDFSPVNLGCRRRIVSGLDRVFGQADRAIVLEDDCLPHPRFFDFCDTLLERFAGCEQVMEIGGANYQPRAGQTGRGFYFSRYAHTHGWATWSRAWRRFDPDIRAWPALRGSGFLASRCDAIEALYWTEIFDRVHAGEIAQSWDYQWQLALWVHEGLSAVPNANLISNIGYGPSATHTRRSRDALARLALGDLFEIGDSPALHADARRDAREFRRAHAGIAKTLIKAVHGRARRRLREIVG